MLRPQLPSARSWIIASVIVGVGLSLAVATLVAQWAGAALRAQAERGLRSEVSLAARDLAGRLDEQLQRITVAADEVEPLGLRDDPVRLQRWLAARKAATPGAAWVGLTNMNGTIIGAAGDVLKGDSAAARDWFILGRAGPLILDRHKALLLEPYLETVPGEPLRLMDFAAPIHSADGKVSGVLAMHLRWEQMRDDLDRLAVALRGGSEMEVTLRAADGQTAVGPTRAMDMTNAVAVETQVRGGPGVNGLNWALDVRLPAAALAEAAQALATRVGWLAAAISLAAILAGALALRLASGVLADNRAAFAAVGSLVPGIVIGAVRQGEQLMVTHYTAPTGRNVPAGADIGALTALLHPDDRAPLMAAYARAEDEADEPNAIPVVIEVRARLDSDAQDWRSYEQAAATTAPELWLRLALRGRTLSTGAVTVEAVGLEVTDIKRAAVLEAENRRLAELRALDADRLAQSKAEVLAVMAHEIRTPLTGVLGFSELLCAADLPAESRTHAEIVHSTGTMLLAIVNDILDLAKIEAGKISIEAIPFEPRAMADQALALIRASAARKNLTLTLEVSPDVPQWLKGDPMRKRQILGNLLGNAAKFTEQGGITVTIGVTPARDLRFTVADTGIGISPDALGRLFTMYGQAELSTARRFGGTGLGLALCRRLVEAMDGRIGAESREGHGSLFWFEVPMQATEAPQPEQSPQTAPRPDGLRVLVVDDVATNRTLLSSMLTGLGYAVTLAESGVEALHALGRDRFDVVLMDVNMPDMDGLEAVRRIRALPDSRAVLPVVALTAGASRADAAEAMAAGMSAHVSKPVSRATLQATIERMMLVTS
jgi:signal transduction histidine kinase/ActR/RegA family two-component response regulator